MTCRSAEGAALVLAAGVSAVGLEVHNFADLPDESLLSPESLYPVLLTAALVALWFSNFRRAATWALLGWAVLNLGGRRDHQRAAVTHPPVPSRAIDPALSLPPALHRHADPAVDRHRRVVATPSAPLTDMPWRFV